MEMRRVVIVKEHLDDDAEESADLRGLVLRGALTLDSVAKLERSRAISGSAISAG